MDCLTCCASFDRLSEFGVKDRKTANVNIIITLRVEENSKYMIVEVNGNKKWIKDESLSKERLADKPVKLMTECGRHLSISSNPKTAQLTLKHNGDDVEKLP